MKTQKQINTEFKNLEENYKGIKSRIGYRPDKVVIMVKNPKTGEVMAKEEYIESLKPKVIK
jgi:hypothetical protein